MFRDTALLVDIITTEEENDRALGIVESLLAEKNLSPVKEQLLCPINFCKSSITAFKVNESRAGDPITLSIVYSNLPQFF